MVDTHKTKPSAWLTIQPWIFILKIFMEEAKDLAFQNVFSLLFFVLSKLSFHRYYHLHLSCDYLQHHLFHAALHHQP